MQNEKPANLKKRPWKATIAFIAFSSFAPFCFAQNSIVSDSLVTDLSCEKLSLTKIYAAIDPTKAFSANKHLPVQNWGFWAGPAKLGGCWSLSHAQRISFYLARFNPEERSPQATEIQHVLNMFRRTAPTEVLQVRGQNTRYVQQYLSYKNPRVFQVPHNSWLEAISPEVPPEKSFWRKLQSGVVTHFKNTAPIHRHLRSEIEGYQVKRFLQLRNLPMAIGKGEGSPKKNYHLALKLLWDLDKNKLPMINIWIERNIQHIVLVKRYNIELNGDLRFIVYDSNQPFKDVELIYKSQQGVFQAPQITGLFLPHFAHKNLGVYRVNDEDFSYINEALLQHYRKACQTN